MQKIDSPIAIYSLINSISKHHSCKILYEAKGLLKTLMNKKKDNRSIIFFLFVPGLAFICQENLDLNMAGTYMSAPATARTHDRLNRLSRV